MLCVQEAYIKCHCSTGQACKGYPDPRTGKPIDFNLLPYYASPELGIYPHTVQFYNWCPCPCLLRRLELALLTCGCVRRTEPAPTYGNVNFTYMLDFLLLEADKRKTVYHGETAYWVVRPTTTLISRSSPLQRSKCSHFVSCAEL